jgi:hypothetical protein
MRPIARFAFLISVLDFHIEPELAELGAVRRRYLDEIAVSDPRTLGGLSQILR